MRQFLLAALLGGGALLAPCLSQAQGVPNPALNAPDELAWQLFIQVNAAAGGTNALFETWASDTDTFTVNPQFPATATPLSLHPPIVTAEGQIAIQENGGLIPAVPPIPASARKRGATRRPLISSSTTISTRSPG